MKKLTIAAFFVSLVAAHASLVAIVSPGYQFPIDGSVSPTYALLNQLATPTVQILGTIGGSNTLSAGSVTGTSMSDDFVDGTTISYNSSSPRQIQVKPSGIFTNQMNTNLWMWPLVQSNKASFVWLAYNHTEFGTNGLGLNLNYDSNFWTTNGLGLTKGGPTNTFAFMQTNGAPTNVFLGPLLSVDVETNVVNGQTNAGPTLTLPTFTTAELLISNGVSYYFTTNHALNVLPMITRWVLVCKNTELGFSVGDEVDVTGAAANTDSSKHATFGANSTEIFFAWGGVGNNWQLMPKAGTSAPQNLTAANSLISNWKLKGYARR